MAKYRYHQIDANHRAIREGLQARGLSVLSDGPLDLIVGFRGINYLLEVKTAKGTLRPTQQRFFARWAGQAAIVRTLEEALTIVGLP